MSKTSRKTFRFGGDSFMGTVYCTRCRCQTERTGTVHRRFYDACPTAAVEIDAEVHTYKCPLCGHVMQPDAFHAFGSDGYTAKAIAAALNIADRFGKERACEMMAKHFYCPGITPALIDRWESCGPQVLAGEDNQSLSYPLFVE